MATRDLNAPPIFAENAETTIPENPDGGTAYRDTTLTPREQQLGILYNKIVGSSSLMNQYFYEITSFLDEVERSGVLAWSGDADYPVDALVVASDNNIYIAKTASTNLNPLSNPAAWGNINDIAAQDYILEDLSNAVKTGTGNTIATNNEPQLINPDVTTQPAGTSSTKAASCEFVTRAFSARVAQKYYITLSFELGFTDPMAVTNLPNLIVPGRNNTYSTISTAGKTVRFYGALSGRITHPSLGQVVPIIVELS